MITVFSKILSVILVFFITLNTTITDSYNNADVERVTENITTGMPTGKLGSFGSSDLRDAAAIVAAAAEDDDGNYYFPDIDYTSRIRAGWPAA